MKNLAKKFGFYTNPAGIKGDISGGLTAGVVALPLCLAFGIASGLGAAAGLYGAIMLSFFAAVFGGTKTQISGPTGPMTVVTASVLLALKGDLSLVVLVFVCAGFFQILLGVLGVGKLVKFIPYPVISGFMSGVGAIIIILQIGPFFGSESYSSVLETLSNLKLILSSINPNSLILAVMTLLIIYLTPKKIASFLPTPLIALIVVSVVAYIFSLDTKTIGEIPSSLPSIVLPSFEFSHLYTVVGYGAVLALLGSIDSLLTSVVADSFTKTKHNPKQELIGQGVGNIAAAFFGGLVGAGATMRTVINIKTGGSTRLSGVVSSIFLLLVLLGLGFLVSKVPLAVLSGILIKVGADILDYRLLTRIKNAPFSDLLVMSAVFLLTVFVDLIFAVGVGVVLSCVLIVYRISKTAKLSTKDDDISLSSDDIQVVSINGPFFFGTSAMIIEKTSAALEAKHLVIDTTKVPFIDLSAAYALEEMIEHKKQYKTEISLVLSKEQLSDKVLTHIKDIVGDKNIYSTLDTALKALKEA